MDDSPILAPNSGSILPEIQSNSILRIALLEQNEDIYVLIAKEYSLECFLLFEEEKHLSKCCSMPSLDGKQIIDFLLSKNTIFVLCLDGTILITTLIFQEDGSITCSTWKELSNNRSSSSNSHPPVKLLSLNDNTIVVMYLQNEMRFVNTDTFDVVSFEFNGVHLSSCSLNNIIYLYLNNGCLYRLEFNSSYNLVSSKKTKIQKDLISLHPIDNDHVIAVTDDSTLLYLDIIKIDRAIVVNTKGQLISDLCVNGNSCHFCTEHGDIYTMVEYQAPSLRFENSHIDHICVPSSNNFMIGYCCASNVYYFPLNSESNNPIKLLSNISRVVDFEKRDDEYILASPTALTSVKKGISCRTSSLTDESYEGLDKLFTINDGSDKYIILSFFNQSKVLRVQEDSIEDYSTQQAFNLNDSTLYASEILDRFILQVTPKETRIMNHEMTQLLGTVTSSKSLATSYNNMIYQSFENKVTGYLVSEDGNINEKFSIAVDNDISSIYAYRDGELIVSTYSGLVYSLSSTHAIITNTLDINEYCIDTNITESILMVKDMLFIGLRDGNLLCFDSSRLIRKYKLGNYPVQLHKSYHDDSLIATSNLSYFITLAPPPPPHEFNISNLIIHEQILSMQNFNLGFESSLLCLTGDNKIKIIIIEPESFQPSVTEIAVGDYQRVVALEENLLLVVSSNYSKLQIMNEANDLMTIHHFQSEQIYSVMPWHSANEEDINKKIKYIVVGSKHIQRKVNPIVMNTDPTRSSLGNIHLLKMATSNNKYTCSHVASMELPYMVYCLSQLNSQYFVAGYGDRLGLFEVASDGVMKLIDQANVRNFVNSVSVSNGLIAITDRYDGLLFFTVQEGKLLYLYNLTSQLQPLNCATCQFINPNTIASMDRNHQLIIWQIKYPATSISQNPNTISVVEKQRYQTKELALKIRALPNNKLFYVTVTGSVCSLELQN